MTRHTTICAIVALALGTPALADTLQVPTQYASIGDAIQHAVDGDTVELAAGTYFEAVDYQGKNIEIRGAGISLTVLSGQQLNTSVVQFVNGEGPGAMLRDLTVSQGNATNGGGVLITQSSPNIVGCQFLRNRATDGGGVYVDGGSPRFDKCEFVANHAWDGAGLGCRQSEVMVENCVFVYNQGVNHGAGLFALHSSLQVRDCDFRQNELTGSWGYGAGLGTYGGSAQAYGSKFTDNEGPALSGLGTMSGAMELYGCSFGGNTAQATGGGLGVYSTSQGAEMLVVDCVVEDNSALYGGGMAILDLWPANASGCSATVMNSTFTGNNSQDGGAIYARRAELDIHDSQLGVNNAESKGGGVYADAATMHFTSVHLRGNQAFDGGGVFQKAGELNLVTCDFERNVASKRGGGLLASNAAVNDLGTVFRDSEAQYGAALYTDQGSYHGISGSWSKNNAGSTGGAHMGIMATIVLDDMFLAENQASTCGGGLAYGSCTVELTDCRLSGNNSNWAGGGAYISMGDASISGTDFQSNHAGLGGGLLINNIDPMIDDCSFTNNVANNTGGGIYSIGDPWISNSLFCGNTPNDIQGTWQDLGGNFFTVDCCPYDVNGDGVVNILDAIAVYQELANAAPNMDWDFNGDGVVDMDDVWEVINNIGGC